MTTTATEQPPREKAQEILEQKVKVHADIVVKHKNHLDALTLAIEIFGSDSDVSFGLLSSNVAVTIPKKDINATLKDIHQRMRRAGWKAATLFNQEYLSWLWRESDTPTNGSIIRLLNW